MTGSIKLIIELKNMMERDIISLENKLEEKKEMFEKLNQIVEKNVSTNGLSIILILLLILLKL